VGVFLWLELSIGFVVAGKVSIKKQGAKGSIKCGVSFVS
jgi:hypothetical protein